MLKENREQFPDKHANKPDQIYPNCLEISTFWFVDFKGKETDLIQAHDKEFTLETKLGEKNLEALGEGILDADLGLNLPGSSGSTAVKQEQENDDIKPVKEMITDLKSAYNLLNLGSEATCLRIEVSLLLIKFAL